jgi:hypothetical protein
LLARKDPSDARSPRFRRRLVRILFAGLAAVLVASGPALANDDDEDESPEARFMKRFLGIDERGSIDYRERPPLVVPPDLNRLPTPETNAVVNSPAWPKDPEVVERNKRQQAQKKQRRRSSEDDDRALLPSELNAGGFARRGSNTPGPGGPQDAEADGQRPLRPSELGTKGSLFGRLFRDNSKPEQATFSGEPTRSSLTEPPPGYRTPSPTHPYGLSPKSEQAKPLDWLNRRGTGE